MEKCLASDFLYWNSLTGGFPDSNILIGVEFEVGGAYEDWGFIIYRKEYVKETGMKTGEKPQFTMTAIASGRNLRTAIENARKAVPNVDLSRRPTLNEETKK